MLSIIRDSLRVATRRDIDTAQNPDVQQNPWADRFVPEHRRENRHKINVLRDLRWY